MWSDRKRVLVTLKYSLIFGIIVATNQLFGVRVRAVHNKRSDFVLQTGGVVEPMSAWCVGIGELTVN